MAVSIIRKVLCFLGFRSETDPLSEPEVLLQRIREVLAGRIAKYNETLAASAAYCELLREQIHDLQARENASRARMADFAEKYPTDPRGDTEFFLLEAVLSERAELETRLAVAEQECSKLATARESAISEAREDLEKLRGEVDNALLGKAIAEVRRLASGVEAPK